MFFLFYILFITFILVGRYVKVAKQRQQRIVNKELKN